MRHIITLLLSSIMMVFSCINVMCNSTDIIPIVFSGSCISVVETGNIIGTCHFTFKVYKVIAGEYMKDTITVSGSDNDPIAELYQKIRINQSKRDGIRMESTASSDTLTITVKRMDIPQPNVNRYLLISVSE